MCLLYFDILEDKEEKKKSEDDSKGGDKEKDEEKESVKEEDREKDVWTLDEKEKLLQFITKVFLMNFPSYIAYKHIVHSSLEVINFPVCSFCNRKYGL